MFESFIQPVADIAADVFGGVASIINPVERREIHPAPTDGSHAASGPVCPAGRTDRVVVLHGHCRSNKGRSSALNSSFLSGGRRTTSSVNFRSHSCKSDVFRGLCRLLIFRTGGFALTGRVLTAVRDVGISQQQFV